MITLLAKIFVPDNNDTKNPSVRQAYGILCGAVGIFLNLCLFAGKFIAGSVSNSIAITADAFNNLSDAGSSIITLIGFKMAGQKPDPHHPFGHGRIEYISGLLVSVIILLMGAELLKSSFSKILHPEMPDFSPMAVAVLLASILVKCYMFLYNRKLGKRLDSSAMLATATDSLSDTMATTVVLIATVTGHFTGLAIDGWCGVLVGLFICYAGYGAARDTVSPLLGQAPEKEFVRQINDIVMSYSDILGIHDLIVHNYGPGRSMASIHAEVPNDVDIETSHEIIDRIERDAVKNMGIFLVIHMDPVETRDIRVLQIRKQVEETVEAVDSLVSIHDFRMVSGEDQINLIFDMVVPYEYDKEKQEELRTMLTKLLQITDQRYRCVITIERSYIAGAKE